MLDEASSDPEEEERESSRIMREAQALDKAMEERIVARKSSASSVASSASGVGMGAAWRSRYGARKRAGSMASNMTNGSVLSEDLVEEEEEQELLGVGGDFDDERERASSMDSNSPADADSQPPISRPPSRPPSRSRLLLPTQLRQVQVPPPSAPVWKSSFSLPPPPATAVRSTFDLPPQLTTKAKRRPLPIGILPPVPSSPIAIVTDENTESPANPPLRKPLLSLPPMRARTESRKPAPPPLHLRSSVFKKVPTNSALSTPSQTLFVFPPSPTLTTRTPSTMTLTSNMNTPIPFPSLSTPRVSTFRQHGRTRSYIGLGAPPTPTTAFSKVDARGYVGMD